MKQNLFRSLVLLSLLGLVLLGLAPPQGASAHAFFQSNRNRATLCGRLVFLEDYKTRVKLIGLIPCNESRPIIFGARPGELFNYYRLTNVVIKKGDRVNTLEYGALENYITRFEAYRQINSCSECNSDAPSAQPPSAESATECADWVLGQAASAYPTLNENQALDDIRQNLQAFAGGAVMSQTCGLDRACRTGAVAQQLGVQLGPRLGWAGLQVEQVIDWLAGLLADPTAVEACPTLNVDAPGLVAGLNQQGYGIDLAAIGAGCDLLAADAQGQQTGFADASAVEQIPGARAVAAPAGQYLLLPSGSTAKFNFACTVYDYVSLALVQRDETGIRQYAFNRMSVRDRTRGQIDLSASPLALSLDVRGDGNVQERKPDRSLLHPALVAILPTPTHTATPAPPSATPSEAPPSSTPQPTVMQTPAPPSPTAAPAATAGATPAPQSNPGGLCPLAFGVAVLPGVLWWKKKRAKPSTNTDHV